MIARTADRRPQSERSLFDRGSQICAICAFPEFLRKSEKVGRADEPLPKRYFLWTGNFEALATFERMNEFRRFDHAFRRSRVEPGIAAPHQFDIERPALEISPIDIRDLEFAARGRL